MSFWSGDLILKLIDILDTRQTAKVQHFHMTAFPTYETPKGAEILIGLVQEVKKTVPLVTGIFLNL